MQPFETESGDATQGLFSPDGKVLIVAEESGHIAFWNLAERRKLGFLTNAPGSLGVLKFSADGRWLVNPGGASPTRVWNVADRSLVVELHDFAAVARAVFSPDGRWLATVGGDPAVRLWETSHWQKARTFRGHTDPITAVDFSPDGRVLATGGRNGEVRLWSVDEPPAAPEQVSLPPSAFGGCEEDGSGFGRIMPPGLSNGVALPWTAEVWTTTPLQRIQTMPLPLVYAELRRLATRKMARESGTQTLQPTALVHEAWLRLGGDEQPAWENRTHFFCAAAEAMRRILIDRARSKQARRHGGGQERLDIDDGEIAAPMQDDELLAVNEALERFSQHAPQKAQLVKLRYFAGMGLKEAGQALGISEPTAVRWWTYSKTWLYQAIQETRGPAKG